MDLVGFGMMIDTIKFSTSAFAIMLQGREMDENGWFNDDSHLWVCCPSGPALGYKIGYVNENAQPWTDCQVLSFSHSI